MIHLGEVFVDNEHEALEQNHGLFHFIQQIFEVRNGNQEISRACLFRKLVVNSF